MWRTRAQKSRSVSGMGTSVGKGQRKENVPLASFQSLVQKVSGCLRGEEVRAGAKEAAGAQVTRYPETVDHRPTTL